MELSKFDKKKEQLRTLTEKWAYFFKHARETREEDLKDIVGSDVIIRRAYDELNRFSWSPEELCSYDSIDMQQEAYKGTLEGAMEKGIEIGVEKGKMEIVRSMLVGGMTPDIIARITGLTVQDVKTLSK